MLEEEKRDFPLTSILAETGGTMGLFLGISIFQIMSFIGIRWIRLMRMSKTGIKKLKATMLLIRQANQIDQQRSKEILL